MSERMPMADAFKSTEKDPQEKIKERLDVVRAELEKRAKIANLPNGGSMTPEAKKANEAAAEYFDSIDPSDPDAEGKVGFLELALNVKPKVYR